MKAWHRSCCAWKRRGWRGRKEERRVNGVQQRGREISGHGAQREASVKPVKMMLCEGLLREGKGSAALFNQYNIETTRRWCFPGAVSINKQHIDNVGARVDHRDVSACRGKGRSAWAALTNSRLISAHSHKVRDAKQALICWIVYTITLKRKQTFFTQDFWVIGAFFGGGYFATLIYLIPSLINYWSKCWILHLKGISSKSSSLSYI